MEIGSGALPVRNPRDCYRNAMNDFKKRTRFIRLPGDRVSLEGWELNTFDEIAGALRRYAVKAAEEAIEVMFDESDKYLMATLPSVDGIGKGIRPDDPLTVRVNFQTQDTDAGNDFDVSLNEMVNDAFDWWDNDDKKQVERWRQLAQSLRELADYIDKRSNEEL